MLLVEGGCARVEGECARVDVEKGSERVFEFWLSPITHTRMHAYPNV